MLALRLMPITSKFLQLSLVDISTFFNHFPGCDLIFIAINVWHSFDPISDKSAAQCHKQDSYKQTNSFRLPLHLTASMNQRGVFWPVHGGLCNSL